MRDAASPQWSGTIRGNWSNITASSRNVIVTDSSRSHSRVRNRRTKTPPKAELLDCVCQSKGLRALHLKENYTMKLRRVLICLGMVVLTAILLNAISEPAHAYIEAPYTLGKVIF